MKAKYITCITAIATFLTTITVICILNPELAQTTWDISLQNKLDAQQQPQQKHQQQPQEEVNATNPTCAQVDFDLTLTKVPEDAPDAFAKYAAFHKRARTCFTGRVCDPMPQALMWGCRDSNPCHGIGDRMRGIQLAFLLSMATKRVFFVKWPNATSAPYELTAALLPSTIDWRMPVPSERAFETDLRLRAAQVDWEIQETFSNHSFNRGDWVPFDVSQKNFTTFYAPLDVIYFRSVPRRSTIRTLMRNPDAAALFPTLQDARVEDLERRFIHALFRPTRIIAELAARRTFPGKQPYTAIHARIGQDVSENELERFQYAGTHGTRTANRLLQRALQAEATAAHRRVFLASDSLQFKRLFVRLAAAHNVQVRTEFARVLHVGKRKPSRYAMDEDAKCAAYLDVFADLYALGHADSMVFMHSGYPMAALSLGNTPKWCEVDIQRASSSDICGSAP